MKIRVLAAVLAVLVVLGGGWAVVNRMSPPSTGQPAPLRIAVVGDSFTEGTAAGGTAPGTNWTSRLVPLLRDRGIDVTIDAAGAGGSGYVATGIYDVTFEQLVPRVVTPDTKLLIVFGSRNDNAQLGIERNALATYAAAQVISPYIELLVIGPPSTSEIVPTELALNRDQVRAAATAVYADFVDPLAEWWFFGPDQRMIGSDGGHPSDAGHLYMAEKIAPHVVDILSRKGIEASASR